MADYRVDISDQIEVSDYLKVKLHGVNGEVKAECYVATHEGGRAGVSIDEDGDAKVCVDGAEFPSSGGAPDEKKRSIEAVALASVARAHNTQHKTALELRLADESRPEQRGWDGFLIDPHWPFDPDNVRRTPVWLQERRLDGGLSEDAGRNAHVEKRYDLAAVQACIDAAVSDKTREKACHDLRRTHLVLSCHLLGERLSGRLLRARFNGRGLAGIWVAPFGEEAFQLQVM